MGLYDELTKNEKTTKKTSSLYEELTGEKIKTSIKPKKENVNIFKTAVNTLNQVGKGPFKFLEKTAIDPLLQLGSSKANPIMQLTDKNKSIGQKTVDTGKAIVADALTISMNPLLMFLGSKLRGSISDSSDFKGKQKIAQEIISKDATKNFVDNTLGYGRKLSNGNTIQQEIDKNSLVKSTNLAGNIAQSVGEMIPSMMVGNLGAGAIGSTTLTGIGGYGSGIEQAYQGGANREQANLYGLGNAVVEGATEWITGGVPGVKSKLFSGLDNLVAKGLGKKTLNEVSKSVTKELLQSGYKIVGEGFEEALAEVISPALKNATYSKGEKVNWQNVIDSAVSGMVVGGLLNAPSDISNIKGVVQNKKLSTSMPQITPIQAPTQTNVQNGINTLPVQQTSPQSPITTNNGAITPINQNNVAKNTIAEEMKPIKDLLNVPQLPEIQQKMDNIEAHEQAVDDYGAFERGGKPRFREVEIAKETDYGKVSRYYRTVAESQVADAALVDDIKATIGSGAGTYVPLGDEKALTNADNFIKNTGYEESVSYINALFNSDKRITKNDIALADKLIQEAKVRGDSETAIDLVTKSAILGSEGGQLTQAFSLIKKLSPEGRLMTLENIVKRENTTNKDVQKRGKKIEISKQDKEAIINAKQGEELDTAVNNAIQNISDQMPLTKADKIRSWRYLAMLGNPRTHLRNMVANTAMYGTAKVKNKVASFLEDVIKPSERTRTLEKASQETLDFVEKDSIETKDRIQGQNKFDAKSQLAINKRAFNNKTLNKLAQGNSNLLQKEDWFFSSRAYKDAMANYITSNKIDTKNITSEQLEKARQYAVKQAQETTFQQMNSLANALSRFENTNNYSKVLVGAVMPFKKTPMNIAKTGIEYSPVSLLKTLRNLFKDVKAEGKLSASSIDTLSKGLTGTGIMLLGYWLTSMGILRGSGADDDKEEYFQENQGEQPYSIRIGGKSYTLDWLSPTAMPLFSGSELYNLVKGKEKINNEKELISFITKAGDALSKITDPLTEMSMLQGVNSTLQSYNASETPVGYLGAVGINAVQNYAGQFIPTVSGQIARTIDDKRRTTTGQGKGLEKIANTFVNKQVAKIPGLSQTLQPYTDIYGREQKSGGIIERAFQNFISPGYLKDINTTKIDKELQSLYDKTGEKTVLPSSAQKYFTINKEKVYLTPKEYTEFNKTDGKYVVSELNKLFNNDAYKRASEESKARAVESIYRAAQAVAKQQYLKDKK